MCDFSSRLLLLVFLQVVGMGTVAAQDPCLNNLLMEELDAGQRNPNYTTPVNVANLCDYQLDETAWYRFESAETNRMPETCATPSHCGTMWPVWMNGTHPSATNPGPIDVQVCAPLVSGSCCGEWSSTIKVKFCEGVNATYNFYVYQLKNVPYCDMAYCAVGGGYKPLSRFPTQLLQPIFSDPIKVTKTKDFCTYDDFYFECEVQYEPTLADDDNQARFEVSLTFDGKPDPTKPSTSVITNTSQLTVRFDSITLRGNVGKTVGCQVTAFWEGQNIRSSVMRSESSYWVGVRFNSSSYNDFAERVELELTETAEIIFYPSVPGLGIATCTDLEFKYDHPMAGISQSADCAVFFKRDNLEHTVSLKVSHRPGCESYSSKLLFKPFNKPLKYPSMWDGYSVDNVRVFVSCNNAPYAPYCWSTLDPYIYTADSHYYTAWTSPGDYLLYRSQTATRLFEVHVRHFNCGGGSATCNCAVAVRENNDILGLYACNTSTVTPIRYMRDTRTPPGEADVISYPEWGDYYLIQMPSGALVSVYLNTLWFVEPSLDIYINSLREDVYHTTGLCGNFNLDSNDDVGEFPSMCSTECQRYRLDDDKSYINGHIYFPPCVGSSETATACRCEDGLAVFNCSETASTKHVPLYNTLGTDWCTTGRRKRQAESGQLDDNIIMPDDFPVPDWGDVSASNPPPTWPSPSGITEDQATERCRLLLEGFSAYATCTEFVDINVLKSICAGNILLTDSLDLGVVGVLQNFKHTCKFNIENSVNSSSDDPAKLPDAVAPLLQTIQDNDCPGSITDCNGQGVCSSGACVCNAGYVGSDCSLSETAVPQLTEFRRGCLCDARKFLCQSAYITARDFYETDTLACKVISADESLNLEYTNPAEVISAGQIKCNLPPSPVNSSANAAVYVWNISVSNDGQNYGNALQLTVYDSLCMDCSSCDGDCSQKAGSCLVAGKCGAVGDAGCQASTVKPPIIAPTTPTRKKKCKKNKSKNCKKSKKRKNGKRRSRN